MPVQKRIRPYCICIALIIGISALSTGCVHRIHVTPAPLEIAKSPIPGTARIQVPFLAMEGPDHMPGIVLLEWPAQDLQHTLVEYLAQRQSFDAVATTPGDWLLTVKGWLTLRAPDRYVYRIHLEATLSHPGRSIVKSYAADGEAVGGSVRWVTSSDQEPITTATNQAIHELVTKLEADAVAFGGTQGKVQPPP